MDIKENPVVPNRLDLSDGSYLLYDHLDNAYRVALYQRKIGQSSNLAAALAEAMKKPIYDPRVTQISTFIEERENAETRS